MLNLQTGLKYRQKIEQKLSLTARQPKGDLCEEVFEDKNTTEIANEVMRNLGTGVEKKKREKKTKKKRPTANGNKRSGVMFNEILGDSDDN